MKFPGVKELMKKYQARAAAEGVDPLGYYMAPQAYAQMQVLEQAITATKSLDDQKLADYIRNNTFKTVLGDVKFGKGGEWAESRVLQVQFQNIKGNDVGQFKGIHPGRGVAARIRVRQGDLSVREGEVAARLEPRKQKRRADNLARRVFCCHPRSGTQRGPRSAVTAPDRTS